MIPLGAERNRAVGAVLIRVLVLNLVVAIAKVVFGYISGAVSILSDGFHSLTDASSNVMGLIGIWVAGQPPDRNHPYGHRKFETVAAAGVTVFLLFVVIEVLRNAMRHLAEPERLKIGLSGFVVMIGTVIINIAVVRYESREAARLGSEILLADATQTRGDVWTSFAVIAALAGASAGYPILDPIAAIMVAGFIGYSGFQIANTTTRILSDQTVISASDLEREVMRVDGVLGCHHIRTRGASDHVFLDMHIWLPRDMRLDDAHSISHVVKDRLMVKFPEIVDAIIHIEPPPRE